MNLNPAMPRFAGTYINRLNVEEMGRDRKSYGLELELTDDANGNDKTAAKELLGDFDGTVQFHYNPAGTVPTASVYVPGATKVRDRIINQAFTPEQIEFLAALIEKQSAINPEVKQALAFGIKTYA